MHGAGAIDPADEMRGRISRPQNWQWFRPWIWWLGFVVIQYVAGAVILGLDPAGFDPCGPEPAGPRGVQTAIAVGAVVVTTALAVGFLRRWNLVFALGAVALSALPWLILLSPSDASCGVPIGDASAVADHAPARHGHR